MGFLRTALHYATVAWNFILGIPSDVGQAFDHIWHFVGSLFTLVAHLFGNVAKDLLQGYLSLLSGIIAAIERQNQALDRIRAWIYRYQITPLRVFLIGLIMRMVRALLRRISAVRALAIALYVKSLAFTVRQVAIERSARIADVRAARAYALKLVKALHSAIENEAARSYNANTPDRVTIIGRIIDDIAARNPAVRGLVKELAVILTDLIDTENPLLRIALNLLLPRIIGGLGIDKALGDLLNDLIGPVAATPRARSLGDAIGSLAARVSAMEDQWTAFMVDGGPEIEQAGDQWKELTSPFTSVALLGFFGLAVADPAGWASAIADTAGTAVNDSAAAIAHLIRNA